MCFTKVFDENQWNTMCFTKVFVIFNIFVTVLEAATLVVEGEGR